MTGEGIMKIKMLMENKSVNPLLACAHGLSMYIETAHHKILMDAGPDSGFAVNAEALGVDLSEIDTVVLSHGHYDHAGGLGEFIRQNDHAVIYAAGGYDLPHYDKKGAYIGVEPVLAGHPRIKVLEDDLKIDDEISILGFRNEQPVYDAGTAGMTEGTVDGFRKVSLHPERFMHEQDLLVTENGKSVLFSGCSHKGIVNIANWTENYVKRINDGQNVSSELCAIVGGFHLMGVQKEDYAILEQVAELLLKVPVTYYTCHCTGADQYEYMKQIMGDSLQYAAVGDEIDI